MAGSAEFQIEGYDWTHLYDTAIPAIISQEAPAGMTTAMQENYRDQISLA
jgi:hypothetical protein